MNKKLIYDFIDMNSKAITDVNDNVWDYTETAFDEFKSMDYISEVLEKFGFKVEKAVGYVPTAFVGTYGSGYPVIGILGEYDGLSGLSQVAGITEQKAIVEGGNGQGCGHNILGAGSFGAAIGIMEYLKQNNRSGTVKYFGCPGEEGGSGKAFMAREGIFDGVDIALTWHPMNTTNILDGSTLANYQVLYKFTGKASHAAASPHLGRSALDAVELMNVGVQFLREHVVQEARIHYAITNSGGFSPNVVQPKAEVLYLIRAPKTYQVEEIYQRINKIAEAMAMATETEVEIEFIKACADVIPNKILGQSIYNNLVEIGLPEYTKEEMAYIDALDSTIDTAPELYISATAKEKREIFSQMEGKSLFDAIVPFDFDREPFVMAGSSDVGDVSWNVPTAQMYVACWTFKTPPHSWQSTTIGRTSVAHKGLIYAAKVLAASAIDALENDKIIQDAKAELKETLGGHTYQCSIPKEVKPKAISRL